MSRPRGEGRARQLGLQARLHDDDPQLHERSADSRSAAQGPAPRPRRGAQHHPHHHRCRQGDGPRDSGGEGEDRRHFAARAHARCVDRGADGGGREEDDHRGSERRLQAGGPRGPQRHPRRERRAARLGRLHRQLLLERSGRALDQRDRRHVSAHVVVVRQRDGLLRALRGPARVPRRQVKKRSLRDLPPAALDGKRALVRVDFNVPFKNGAVTDDTRIRAAAPTIAYLREKGARVVLLSHFGRPKGPDPKSSLKQIVRDVERVLGTPVDVIPDPATGVPATRRLPRGGVALVENTRFWPGEEANDAAFARTLAALGDFYVNDAFGSAHRAHASTEAVARLLRPGVSGFLMEQELRYLGEALEQPKRPFVAVLGGAKISGKIDVIQALLPEVDEILIGGAMANTFFLAIGFQVGGSLVERDKEDVAKELLAKAGAKLILPRGGVVAPSLARAAERQEVSSDHIPADCAVFDIDRKSTRLNSSHSSIS